MITQNKNGPQSVRAQVCSDIELKVASSRHERQEAFELTYRSYVRAGLCEEHDSGMRATLHQLQPSTDTFLAKLRGEVISTVSLVRDGNLGLPMEDVFPEVVAERRAAGMRIAEVSCLADRRSDAGRFFELFCELGRLMAQLAMKGGIDELLVVVHPRHAAIYRRFMAFRRVGDRRDYASVRGNPAVALVLNFAEAQLNNPDAWARFFGERLPDEALQSSPPSTADCEYYESILSPVADCVPFGFSDADLTANVTAAALLCAQRLRGRIAFNAAARLEKACAKWIRGLITVVGRIILSVGRIVDGLDCPSHRILLRPFYLRSAISQRGLDAGRPTRSSATCSGNSPQSRTAETSRPCRFA